VIGLVDAPGGIHQILKNIDGNGIGTINIKILSINCIFAVDSNNFHTTVHSKISDKSTDSTLSLKLSNVEQLTDTGKPIPYT